MGPRAGEGPQGERKAVNQEPTSGYRRGVYDGFVVAVRMLERGNFLDGCEAKMKELDEWARYGGMYPPPAVMYPPPAVKFRMNDVPPPPVPPPTSPRYPKKPPGAKARKP
mgnify:CR=1 FL=1